jgi:hypothetical protein
MGRGCDGIWGMGRGCDGMGRGVVKWGGRGNGGVKEEGRGLRGEGEWRDDEGRGGGMKRRDVMRRREAEMIREGGDV